MSTLYFVTPFAGPSNVFHLPGEPLDSVNDAKLIVAAQAGGAVLVSDQNGAAKAAALLCQTMHTKQGADPQMMANIMMGAVADQGSNMPKGANVAVGATAKPDLTSGKRFVLPAATLAANQVLTLAAPGDAAFVANLFPILQGTRREFTRLDATAFTWAFLNGGPGAGTLITLPVSKVGGVVVEFSGTDWELVYGSPQ